MSDIIETRELSVDARAALQARMTELLESSRDFHTITTADEFAGAGECLRAVKTLESRIKGEFADPIDKAHKAHQAMLAMRNKYLDPVSAEGKRLNSIMSNYTAAEQIKANAERRRLEDEARKRAEDERLAQAQALSSEGLKAEAEAALNAPVIVTAPAVVVPQAKADGVSVRTNWRHEVIDVNQVPREYMIPDDTKLAAYARMMRDTAAIPGVKFYAEQSMSAKRF